MTEATRPFGIYIHWPYCLSKCPYCDFFSQVKKDIPQEKIIKDYLDDLDFYAGLTFKREVTSIFFGGGTPSLITPSNIEKIINHICSRWNLSAAAEISLEANPNTQTPDLFKDLRCAGINRLSLGVQSLCDKELKFLGRTHNALAARQAIDQVLKNFDNHSLDLIYALPEQEISEWKKQLDEAAQFGFKHISLYQLTIEEGTVFHKKGLKSLEEEAAAEMYSYTQEAVAALGYHKYEVSNYAQEGFESHHNKLYWQGDDYLGIGPSAHGRLKTGSKIYATTHSRQLEELTPGERAEELIIMGLRLTKGIDKINFYQQCGINFEEFINHKKATHLKSEGLLTESLTHFKATSKGFLVLDYLISELCS